MSDGRCLGWFTVPIAVTITVTNDAGTTVVTITPGVYTLATLVAQLQTDLQTQRPPAGTAWTVSLSIGATGTGQVTIDAPTDTWSITWTSTDLRDLLGFTADIAAVTTPQTGPKQARGLWMPDTTLFVDGFYKAAIPVSDLIQTEGPTGFVIGHSGNKKYKQRNLKWGQVPINRTWIAAELVANESLEQFLTDVQWGEGHAWFRPSSKIQVIAHTGVQLGNGAVVGWYFKGCADMTECVRRYDATWDGQWTFTVDELTSNG
jgi:hypothetical protein